MRNRTHTFDIVIGLLLTCLFAGFMLLVLASGARIYGDISDVMDEQYGTSTVLSYVTARVRAFDAEGSVRVGQLDGCSCLVFSEQIDGDSYDTFVYCYNGRLMELCCLADAGLGPDAGLEIMTLDSLTFDALRGGSLIRVTCSRDGVDSAQLVSVQGGRAVLAQ